MTALKIFCWLVVTFAIFAKWDSEHYVGNSIITAGAILSLAAIYIAERVTS